MPSLYQKPVFLLTGCYAQRPAWVLSLLFHYSLIIAVLKLTFENVAAYIQLQISQTTCIVKILPLQMHWRIYIFLNVSLVYKSVIYLTRFGAIYAKSHCEAKS